MKAIRTIAESELRESFGGQSPEAFCLDRQGTENLLQVRIDDLESTAPWSECCAYFRKLEKPQTDDKP